MNIIPTTVVGAFATGDILQVLFFSMLFGIALLHLGEEGRHLIAVIDQFSHALFRMINMMMRVAPIGAFGAMAFTIGSFGIGTLLQLGALMAGVYMTCLFFMFVVLGIVSPTCRASASGNS